MTIKKDSSNAKKTNKVAGKRHAKITVPKGEKVSSMKHVDVSSAKLFQAMPPGHH
jgi:hypothetical protein